jgi:hypothetical protein
MTNEDSTALLHLQWATQALALNGVDQLALFPEEVDRPFELVDDFDNWLRASRWRTWLLISSAQLSALQQVQDALDLLARTEFTEDAVLNSASWASLRLLARRVLELFDWPCTRPPRGRSAYVPAG